MNLGLNLGLTRPASGSGSAVTFQPSLKFNDARNSQYLVFFAMPGWFVGA